MHRYLSLACGTGLGLCCMSPGAAVAAPPPESTAAPTPEKMNVDPSARIEALIAHIGGMNKAKFIRNGSEYDAASAAKFLRAKWDKQRAEIHSPEDFIAKVATKSSTSGKPYQIRLENGEQTECGPYLSGVLKKLEGKGDKDK